MRLKTPARIDDALSELKRQQSECHNSLNPSNAEERLRSFLDWCNAAEGMLGNHFFESSLFDHLHVSRAQAMNLTGKPVYMVNGFLNREYRAWETAFGTEIQRLGRLKIFAAVPGHPVALDTSALMEGPFFTESAWASVDPSLTGESVRLLAPILVMEELDGLKSSRDGRARDRARRTIRMLAELHGSTPTQAVPLPRHPETTIEVVLDSDSRQRHPSNDAEIVYQALLIRDLLGEQTMMATRDIAQMYRARAAGLRVAFIPPVVEDAPTAPGAGTVDGPVS